MSVGFLLERFERRRSAPALIWRDRMLSYGELLERIVESRGLIAEHGIQGGQVVALEGDFSPRSVGTLIALAERGVVVVPLTTAVRGRRDRFEEVARVSLRLDVGDDDGITVTRRDATGDHPLLETLRRRGHPGLVLFSSGSTGESKAALHDLAAILDKFRVERPARRMLTFLLFDHIGGVNTLFHTLASGGSVVTVEDRSPAAVCRAIETHRVEVLPTSPTFLNLLLLSGAAEEADLSSLQLITYGTEVMPEGLLQRLHDRFPDVKLQQTYGLSELGILRSRSESSDSLWVRVGGEGFQTRIREGLLEIKAASAMLGYLNAESPFTEDGWFRTGDRVEQKGDYIRILGRDSEIINVGGQKVFPGEVENVIQEMQEVREVVVHGEPNAITGQVVAARITPRPGVAAADLRRAVRQHCRTRLEAFKVPQKIVVSSADLHSGRYKKERRLQESPVREQA